MEREKRAIDRTRLSQLFVACLLAAAIMIMAMWMPVIIAQLRLGPSPILWSAPWVSGSVAFILFIGALFEREGLVELTEDGIKLYSRGFFGYRVQFWAYQELAKVNIIDNRTSDENPGYQIRITFKSGKKIWWLDRFWEWSDAWALLREIEDAAGLIPS